MLTNKVSLCCLVTALWGCSAPDNSNGQVDKYGKPAVTHPAPDNSIDFPADQQANPAITPPAPAAGIVLVSLAKDIRFRWNNQTSFFVEDELFRSLVATFPRKQHRLVALILDTTATAAVACAGTSESRRLVTGDLAFSLVLRIGRIPWYDVYQMQFDSFEYNCPFPSGQLNYITKNRTAVWRQTVNYLAHTAQTRPPGE